MRSLLSMLIVTVVTQESLKIGQRKGDGALEVLLELV